MLKPLTERQKTLIVNNVLKAVKNIDTLNKTGYNFLMLSSGFIAHDNLYDFISHFTDYSLKDAIILNARNNEWKNFKPGDQNYDYYMTKAEVYKRILEKII